MDSESDPDDFVDIDILESPASRKLENSIITNDINDLKHLLQQTDVNVPLNERRETALILAVKLSHLDIVKLLIMDRKCDKNYINVNNCSPLDLALVTAFDNRLEPRHSICWLIVATLLENRAEPVCKDAMMYVIRTALKYEDSSFIFRLIDTCIASATSITFHELLLQKLHRHQPMCTGIIDPFLERAGKFSVKLLKIVNGDNLGAVISSFEYYIESHWSCRETKASVFKKLILYASGAGWHYTKSDTSAIRKMCPGTAHWCTKYTREPLSLRHICRVTFRHHVACMVHEALKYISLPETIKNYILLSDIDYLFTCANPDFENFMF